MSLHGGGFVLSVIICPLSMVLATTTGSQSDEDWPTTIIHYSIASLYAGANHRVEKGRQYASSR
jgi:hypothetical protein